jgi:hypothetical protein
MTMVRTWSDAKAVAAIITSSSADTKDAANTLFVLLGRSSSIFLLQFPLSSFIRSKSSVGSISTRTTT